MLERAAGPQRHSAWERWRHNEALADDLDRLIPYAAVAEAVVALRVQHGLTQAEFAERVGTTQSVIARLESGNHEIRIGLLNRMAAALDLTWHPAFEIRGVHAVVAAPVPWRATVRKMVSPDRSSPNILRLDQRFATLPPLPPQVKAS